MNNSREKSSDEILKLIFTATKVDSNGRINCKHGTQILRRVQKLLETDNNVSWDQCILLEDLFIESNLYHEKEEDISQLISCATQILSTIARKNPREFTIFSQEWIVNKCKCDLNNHERQLSSYLQASIDATLNLIPRAIPPSTTYLFNSLSPLLRNPKVRIGFVVSTFSLCIRKYLKFCEDSSDNEFVNLILEILLKQIKVIFTMIYDKIHTKKLNYNFLSTEGIELVFTTIEVYEQCSFKSNKLLESSLDLEKEILGGATSFVNAFIQCTKTSTISTIPSIFSKFLEINISKLISRHKNFFFCTSDHDLIFIYIASRNKKPYEVILGLDALEICLTYTKIDSTSLKNSQLLFKSLIETVTNSCDSHIVNRSLKFLEDLLVLKPFDSQLQTITDLLKGSNIKLQNLTLALYMLDSLINIFWDDDESIFGKQKLKGTIFDNLLDIEGPILSGNLFNSKANVFNSTEFCAERCGIVGHLINILTKTISRSIKDGLKNTMWSKKSVQKLSSFLLLPLHKQTKSIIMNTVNSINRDINPQLAYLNILSFNIEMALLTIETFDIHT